MRGSDKSARWALLCSVAVSSLPSGAFGQAPSQSVSGPVKYGPSGVQLDGKTWAWTRLAEVTETPRGLLYQDGVLRQVLGAGRYKLPAKWGLPFLRRPRTEIVLVDVRERDLTIKGPGSRPAGVADPLRPVPDGHPVVAAMPPLSVVDRRVPAPHAPE